MNHTVGSHSDDRGGDSDYPCHCDDVTTAASPDNADSTEVGKNAPTEASALQELDKIFGQSFLPYKVSNTGSQLDIYEKVTQVAFDRAKQDLSNLIREAERKARINELRSIHSFVVTENMDFLDDSITSHIIDRIKDLSEKGDE